jgi:hypothetical protein
MAHLERRSSEPPTSPRQSQIDGSSHNRSKDQPVQRGAERDRKDLRRLKFILEHQRS